MQTNMTITGKTIIPTALIFLIACNLSFLSADQRQSGKQGDYLEIVKAYANTMIKDGRDTYGTKHSPLFASALDRHTMRIGSFDDIPGVRKTDRSFSGANPQEEVRYLPPLAMQDH